MTTVAQIGPGESITIDGTDILLPAKLVISSTLAQSITETAGRPRLDAWHFGDGLPNVLDPMTWEMEYSLGDDQSTVSAFLETLRTQGGVHLLATWKAQRYTYTARSGQQFFYLPRNDAYTLSYVNHTSSDLKAVVTRNGVALTVAYKATVASGDAVPSGECWIANQATGSVTHTRAGFVCAPFKIGTAISINDVILVEYHPLYRVGVVDVSTDHQTSGLDMKTLRMVELS